jgi:hypothetical protein
MFSNALLNAFWNAFSKSFTSSEAPSCWAERTRLSAHHVERGSAVGHYESGTAVGHYKASNFSAANTHDIMLGGSVGMTVGVTITAVGSAETPGLTVIHPTTAAISQAIGFGLREQVSGNSTSLAQTRGWACEPLVGAQIGTGYASEPGLLLTVCSGAAFIGSSALGVDPSPTLTRSLGELDLRRSVLSPGPFEALQRQLRALLEDEGELADAGISVSPASLHALIDFLASNDGRAHPNISITRTGSFAASWSPKKHAKLTLVFVTPGAGQWVAVDLDEKPPTTGEGSIKDLPPQFERWMTAV